MNRKKLWACISSLLWLAWLGFIYSNSLKSRSSSAAQSKPLEDFIKPPLNAVGITENTDRIAELIIRKAAHLTEFFVLTLLCILVLHFLGKSLKQKLCISAVLSFVAACVDETLQIFSNRGAAFTDVLIDSVGVLIAVALYAVIIKLKSKRSR